MFRALRVAVVIPAFNESRAIATTVRTLPSWVDAVIVVDDASRDDTSARARDAVAATIDPDHPRSLRSDDPPLYVLRHPANRGVGAAISTGYCHALALGVDAAVVMGGDGQMDPADLPALLAPIAEGRADYVKGNRFLHREVWREMPITRLAGNLLLSTATKITSGYRHVFDSQCGYTAIHRDALARLPLDDLWPRYGYPNDLLARLHAIRARVVEVPVKPIYGAHWKSGINLRTVIHPIPWVLLRSWGMRLTARARSRAVSGSDAPIRPKYEPKYEPMLAPVREDAPKLGPAKLDVASLDVANLDVANLDVANLDVPNLDVPNLDVPNLDVPNLDVPSLDVANLDVPNLDVPNLDVANLDVPNLDVPNRCQVIEVGLRIGVVTTSYPRFVGDPAGGFVAGHVAALRALGHRVEVIAAGEGGERVRDDIDPLNAAGTSLLARRVPDQTLFYRGGAPDLIEASPVRGALAAARFTARLTVEVARRAHRWDSIITHWLVPSAIAALPTGLPMLAIAHGGDIHTLRRLGLLAPTLFALHARDARIAFVSEQLRAIAREAAPGLASWLDGAIVQPMGIAIDHFRAIPRAPLDPPTIVIASRLVPVKGIDVAIAAMAHVRAPVRLVIAGDGPMRAELTRLARAGLSPGWVSTSSVQCTDPKRARCDREVDPVLDGERVSTMSVRRTDAPKPARRDREVDPVLDGEWVKRARRDREDDERETHAVDREAREARDREAYVREAREAHDREAHDREAHDREAHDREAHVREAHVRDAHDREIHDREAHDREIHDREAHDRQTRDREDTWGREDHGRDRCQIAFLGAVPTSERDRLLRGASAVLVPSRVLPSGRSEGTPTIALEALAAGVPVIASAVGGLSSLSAIDPLRSGIRLVPPDDPRALAAAIDRTLADPPPASHLRAAVEHLDWHRVVTNLR